MIEKEFIPTGKSVLVKMDQSISKIDGIILPEKRESFKDIVNTGTVIQFGSAVLAKDLPCEIGSKVIIEAGKNFTQMVSPNAKDILKIFDIDAIIGIIGEDTND